MNWKTKVVAVLESDVLLPLYGGTALVCAGLAALLLPMIERRTALGILIAGDALLVISFVLLLKERPKARPAWVQWVLITIFALYMAIVVQLIAWGVPSLRPSPLEAGVLAFCSCMMVLILMLLAQIRPKQLLADERQEQRPGA